MKERMVRELSERCMRTQQHPHDWHYVNQDPSEAGQAARDAEHREDVQGPLPRSSPFYFSPLLSLLLSSPLLSAPSHPFRYTTHDIPDLMTDFFSLTLPRRTRAWWLSADCAGAVTLSIGDGANDELMIKAAHVGVGISGMEVSSP